MSHLRAHSLCCPYCGTFVSDSRVIDTRLENNGYRRRQCLNEACDSRFTTREHVVESRSPVHRSVNRGQLRLGL
jgi:transcriptional regulator NrdR family protein